MKGYGRSSSTVDGPYSEQSGVPELGDTRKIDHHFTQTGQI